MCIFDNPENLFNYIKIGYEVKCEKWIDYEKINDKMLWYAVLNQIPYVEGHTLVILGSCKARIFADNIPKNELSSILLGINRISKRMIKLLDVENVHVISMCEEMQHLHFHLLPRPKEYTKAQVNYMKKHYFKREKRINPNLLFGSFSTKVDNDISKYHGMWYGAFLEQNPLYLKWKSPEESAREIEKTAKKLRNKNKKKPFLD